MMITLFVALLPSLVYLAMRALDSRSTLHDRVTTPLEWRDALDCAQVGRVYINGVGECTVIGPVETVKLTAGVW